MIKQVESILADFRSCFSRKAAFHWFLIVMMGLLIRCDHEGVSSVIRWLSLAPACYDLVIGFFRAHSWSVTGVVCQWVSWAVTHCPLMEFNGRVVLIGDGIKVAKEAKKMPAVKSLHQESDNSGKAEYIRGHHFGFVGLLVGSLKKAFCLPLHGQLQEGIQELRPAEGLNGKPATLVTRMAHLLVKTAQQTGCLCYATVDAYFAVGPTFLILKAAVTDTGQPLVHLITRAKDNTVAYRPVPSGKLFQEKDKVKLRSLFDCPERFTPAQVVTYGQKKTIQYDCVDLLWKPIQGLLRFVLVWDGPDRYILLSSDLDLAPTQIITIYSYRSKIEVMFLFLKHLIGGFAYHFWTKSFPRLKRRETLNSAHLSARARHQFDQTVEAIERFVNLAGMALGILQYLSLTSAAQIWTGYHGWLRTYSSEFPSEEVVQRVIQTEFFSADKKVPFCRTLQVIQERRRKPLMKLVA